MRQKLGQHFLINPEISQAIAAALEPAPGDTIIEVGPGHGELTAEIISAIEAAGGRDIRLVAVEKDSELAKSTKQRFGQYPFIEVVEADILEFFSDSSRQELLETKYKIVGNLPYYLTGHLLRIVGELEKKPDRAIFMVQREVAERMAAVPPRMNRLAAAVQFWAKPQVLFNVARNEFNPPPEVDSAVVLLTPQTRAGWNEAGFYETIRILFAQPRKTILNNLKKASAMKDLGSEEISRLIEKTGIDPNGRPQDLSLEEISILANLAPKI